jgi:hypothetical protein
MRIDRNVLGLSHGLRLSNTFCLATAWAIVRHPLFIEEACRGGWLKKIIAIGTSPIWVFHMLTNV